MQHNVPETGRNMFLGEYEGLNAISSTWPLDNNWQYLTFWSAITSEESETVDLWDFLTQQIQMVPRHTEKSTGLFKPSWTVWKSSGRTITVSKWSNHVFGAVRLDSEHFTLWAESFSKLGTFLNLNAPVYPSFLGWKPLAGVLNFNNGQVIWNSITPKHPSYELAHVHSTTLAIRGFIPSDLFIWVIIYLYRTKSVCLTESSFTLLICRWCFRRRATSARVRNELCLYRKSF